MAAAAQPWGAWSARGGARAQPPPPAALPRPQVRGVPPGPLAPPLAPGAAATPPRGQSPLAYPPPPPPLPQPLPGHAVYPTAAAYSVPRDLPPARTPSRPASPPRSLPRSPRSSPQPVYPLYPPAPVYPPAAAWPPPAFPGAPRAEPSPVAVPRARSPRRAEGGLQHPASQEPPGSRPNAPTAPPSPRHESPRRRHESPHRRQESPRRHESPRRLEPPSAATERRTVSPARVADSSTAAVVAATALAGGGAPRGHSPSPGGPRGHSPSPGAQRGPSATPAPPEPPQCPPPRDPSPVPSPPAPAPAAPHRERAAAPAPAAPQGQRAAAAAALKAAGGRGPRAEQRSASAGAVHRGAPRHDGLPRAPPPDTGGLILSPTRLEGAAELPRRAPNRPRRSAGDQRRPTSPGIRTVPPPASHMLEALHHHPARSAAASHPRRGPQPRPRRSHAAGGVQSRRQRPPSGPLAVGDAVEVITDRERARELCHAVKIPFTTEPPEGKGPDLSKASFLGMQGTLAELDADGTAKVHFAGGYCNWWPLEALQRNTGAARRAPPEAFSDDVRLWGAPLSGPGSVLQREVDVIRDVDLLERLCAFNGSIGKWGAKHMAAAGRRGVVVAVDDSSASCVVRFRQGVGDVRWPFTALRLVPCGSPIAAWVRGGAALAVDPVALRRAARSAVFAAAASVACSILRERWSASDAAAAAGAALVACVATAEQKQRRYVPRRSRSPPQRHASASATTAGGRPSWDSRTRRTDGETTSLIALAAARARLNA
eukprot:TRINITY_DN2607_c1_g1_i2.p1 TRINITY_DN2607_c1_g1~~TRINITY_DN2607_c1_g1_i2.p1  ORF type:complete len:770 (+),score=105.32 TRINITY_DN2607_c1_g1_i2:76-2385(+)